MKINSNFTLLENKQNSPKQETTKRDLTSFSPARKNIIQDSFTKKNNKVAFKGVWKPGPKVPYKWLQIHSDPGTNGSPGAKSETISERESYQYHPYSWEQEPTITPKENIIVSGRGSFFQTSELDSESKDYKTLLCNPNSSTSHDKKFVFPQIGTALNREESLKQVLADKYPATDSEQSLEEMKERLKNVKILQERYEKRAKGHRQESTVWSALGELVGAENHFSLAREDDNTAIWYENEKEQLEPKIDKEQKRQGLIEEIKILETEREKGELIDISVRNVNNPDAPFESFLNKAKREKHDLNWVEGKQMATPHETIKVADAILITLGIDKKRLAHLETPEKKLIIKAEIIESDFVSKILRGLPKLLKR